MLKIMRVMWLLMGVLLVLRITADNSRVFDNLWNIMSVLLVVASIFLLVENANKKKLNLMMPIQGNVEYGENGKPAVTLVWNDSSWNQSYKYIVYRKEETSFQYSEMKQVTECSFRDETVVAGRAYTYWVAWSETYVDEIRRRTDTITLLV